MATTKPRRRSSFNEFMGEKLRAHVPWREAVAEWRGIPHPKKEKTYAPFLPQAGKRLNALTARHEWLRNETEARNETERLHAIKKAAKGLIRVHRNKEWKEIESVELTSKAKAHALFTTPATRDWHELSERSQQKMGEYVLFAVTRYLSSSKQPVKGEKYPRRLKMNEVRERRIGFLKEGLNEIDAAIEKKSKQGKKDEVSGLKRRWNIIKSVIEEAENGTYNEFLKKVERKKGGPKTLHVKTDSEVRRERALVVIPGKESYFNPGPLPPAEVPDYAPHFVLPTTKATESTKKSQLHKKLLAQLAEKNLRERELMRELSKEGAEESEHESPPQRSNIRVKNLRKKGSRLILTERGRAQQRRRARTAPFERLTELASAALARAEATKRRERILETREVLGVTSPSYEKEREADTRARAAKKTEKENQENGKSPRWPKSEEAKALQQRYIEKNRYKGKGENRKQREDGQKRRARPILGFFSRRAKRKMQRLKNLPTAREMIEALRILGYKNIYSDRYLITFKKNRQVVRIPNIGGHRLRRPDVNDILKAMNITPEKFVEAFRTKIK